MGKIRTVKPELFRHEQLFEAEQKFKLPLRLAFIGLFSCCDREGRFRWEPRSLKLDILPYDDTDFTQVLNALWETGFIKKYTNQGKYYGHIPSWHSHQSINKHEPLSKLPDPKQCAQEIPPSVHNTAESMQNNMVQLPLPVLSMPAYASSTQAIGLSAKSEEKFYPNQLDTKSKNDSYLPSPEMHMPTHALHETASEMPMHTSLEVEVEVEVEMEVELELEKEVEVETETGEKSNLGANQNIVAPARRRSMADTDVFKVFDFWKITLGHLQAVLDSKRQRLIRQALQSGYSVAQLCDAISGCAKTPHNLGDNDRGQRYDGLHIILRDSDQIERFMRNHHNPPRAPNSSEKLVHANLTAGKAWLNKKLSGGTTQ